MLTIRFVSAAIACVALQLQIHAVAATSLKDDPVTTCTSYDIGNKNFPGRGSEIEDDGTCIVIVPGNPSASKRKLEAILDNDIIKLEDFFGAKMEKKLKNLPTSASHHPLPWNGPSWLTYQDSINYEWKKGQPSPAEKYATAFGLNVNDFMNKVSAQSGIDSQKNVSTSCTTGKDCDSSWELTMCAIRTNATSGYCIPSWYGLSHAWAPASVIEKEPLCPVVFNGVSFHPIDIMGLITQIYDDANVDVPVVFTGSRYSGGNDSTDSYGRSSDYSYRDVNPGFFHIAASNLLGKLNHTFIIDKYPSYGVWNLPVYGFKVLEQTSMTLKEAAQNFYHVETYPWNENSTSIVHIKSRLLWNNETSADSHLIVLRDSGVTYEYLLELGEDEEIIGGEWLNESNDDHPDFLWFPKGKPAADSVTSIGLSYANVTVLLEKAAVCSDSA
ncbi:hypothetical protein F441_21512 [Phytophthora nicotianae CJ01A1]|uniref:Uncharacterized protein n=3 Tax=Phytophthora nicotianae TaxID=4792 RepID=W2M873_PHYNI|nr:hypothetical protein L915_21022 [Phytophthora nicotianae]ETL25229.1 hypothetical protein L916_20898 [Phytophthora nicotianae]ETM31714.1 hypothetical protein L914_20765 [Phytophthora nicotianae]ETO60118.1 hypothetical protein F444_21657 [Phytophthora nicotianae P1976]ETP01221.1 hypothetical protein F441_21512 [Phytophthora nicotianae CJ01A1]